MYDIVIIGSGPAGLTAAVYGKRAGKSVLVLEKGAFGGQMTYSPKIENYPGFSAVSGNELADKMVEQALYQGADIEPAQVLEIRDGDIKTVVTDLGQYETKTIIIAAGVKHRRLGLEHENELIGNGISFCAVCDGAFCKGKTVGVIGGGNSALQEALLLVDNADKVIIFQDLPYLTGEEKLINLVNSNDRIEVRLGSKVAAYLGEKEIEGIVTQNADNTQNVTKLEAVFVAIGLEPENEIFQNAVALDGKGYIIADESCQTSAKGIFAAGDCRTKNIRQIACAVSDGAVSALAASDYIDKRSGESE